MFLNSEVSMRSLAECDQFLYLDNNIFKWTVFS